MNKQSETQNPKKSNKVVGIIVDVVLILAIAVALFCTYSAYVSKTGTGVPKLFGTIFLSIQSDSMSPTFDSGDMIIDKVVKDTDTLEVGDVITFWTVIDGYRVLNTHRIVEINPGSNFTYFITKGDNNSQIDSVTVHESEVVGIQVSRIKNLGTVMDFLQTAKGFFCVIVLPVLAFFIYYLVSFFKVLFEYKKAKNRLEFEEEQRQRVAAANPAQINAGSVNAVPVNAVSDNAAPANGASVDGTALNNVPVSESVQVDVSAAASGNVDATNNKQEIESSEEVEVKFEPVVETVVEETNSESVAANVNEETNSESVEETNSESAEANVAEETKSESAEANSEASNSVSDQSSDDGNITLTKDQLLALLKQAGIDPTSLNKDESK